MSHILILGGDGYLGWPTAMYFSIRGHEVTVVDNYFRRNACKEMDTGMLYSVPSLTDRSNTWYERTGKEIKVVISDLNDPESMRKLFNGKVNYDWSKDKKYTGNLTLDKVSTEILPNYIKENLSLYKEWID